MIDNLKYNREQARTAKQDKSHGFAFAIQPNGSLLGDESHVKRKRQRPQFTFMSSQDIAALPRGRNAPLHPPPQNCLATIQQLLQQASIEYQKQTKLPPVPEKADSSSVSQRQSSASFSNSHSNTSSFQPPPEPSRMQSNPQIQQQQNYQTNDSTNTSSSNNSTSYNSNHNAPYSSSNVNHQNPYNAISNSNSNNQNPFKSGAATSSSQPRKENRHPNQPADNSYPSNNNRSTSNKSPIVIDDDDDNGNNGDDDFEFMDANDDFDDVLANFDVDEAVRGRNSMDSNNGVGTFDYGNDFGDSSNHGNTSNNHGSSSGPVSFNAMPYEDNFGGSGQGSSFNYDNSSNNNFSSYGDGNGYQNNDYQNNHNNFAVNNDDSNAPLCPEHNLPCRLLTAKSASNMGRQFYKCSLPEHQQCDFFQWADGMEGNWNDSTTGPMATTASGDTKDMYQENQRIFGHRAFRPGQKEVIEKAIQGRDVFVLMPTGGGKSLCYQLPAWCCPGLAVVISPLLSLIQDQVQSMTKVGVQSVFLSSKQDYDTEQRMITNRLEQMTSHDGIKILYLTPEKLTHSNQMKRILRKLYQKGLLSRFVVDEAHCLSDWGHDFRPDYNNLGTLRREFPNTPLMALTATANEKVVNDAIRALGMRNHHLYRSSFNRKNLHYEVRKKDGKVVKNIAEYIASRPQDSGVVYCLSRKNCEDVSEKLQKMLREQGHRNVRVSFYHAELDQRERDRRHHAWSIGQISVLCATIAFGMGIDKPDVRYVIHYSMPKSITHYYQESGRAGRDGDQADCILFYHYKDKKTLENMIRKSSNNPNSASTRRKIDQLYTCVRYCEDEFRCRRTMQLEFFGENFDRRKCNGTCDNCKAGKVADRRDMTKAAQDLMRILTQAQSNRNFGGNNVTMNQVADLYRGSKSKAMEGFQTNRIQGYGAGSGVKKFDIDRIMHAMIFERLLVEESSETNVGFMADYLQLGENAQAVLNGSRKFYVEFPSATRSRKKAASKASTTTAKKKDTKKKKAEPKVSKGKRKSSASSGTPSTTSSDGLKFTEVADSSDDEAAGSSPTFAQYKAGSSVLSEKQTSELNQFIKKMTTLWAQEEQEMGNHIFYWNILSNDVIKSVASYCPTSEEELITLGLLGEAKRKEYGERLINAIQRFLKKNDISLEYVRSKRPVKRAKVDSKEDCKPAASKKNSNEVIMIDDDDDEDEFDTGIDFAAIEMPDAPSASDSAKKSHYFGK